MRSPDVLFAVPLVGYIVGPSKRKEIRKELAWITLGSLTQFPEGETRLATYRNPFVRPWDGDTANIPCWVRRISADKLQVFAINCAHLGLSGALVSAIGIVHVPVPWRRLLCRRRACLGPTPARPLPIRLQD